MNEEMDRYFESCLKNWVARHRFPADGKPELLRKVGQPPVEGTIPFARFFSAFANRWSSPSEQFYSQRHWQISGPMTLSIQWSFHLATNTRLAH